MKTKKGSGGGKTPALVTQEIDNEMLMKLEINPMIMMQQMMEKMVERAMEGMNVTMKTARVAGKATPSITTTTTTTMIDGGGKRGSKRQMPSSVCSVEMCMDLSEYDTALLRQMAKDSLEPRKRGGQTMISGKVKVLNDAGEEVEEEDDDESDDEDINEEGGVGLGGIEDDEEGEEDDSVVHVIEQAIESAVMGKLEDIPANSKANQQVQSMPSKGKRRKGRKAGGNEGEGSACNDCCCCQLFNQLAAATDPATAAEALLCGPSMSGNMSSGKGRKQQSQSSSNSSMSAKKLLSLLEETEKGIFSEPVSETTETTLSSTAPSLTPIISSTTTVATSTITMTNSGNQSGKKMVSQVTTSTVPPNVSKGISKKAKEIMRPTLPVIDDTTQGIINRCYNALSQNKTNGRLTLSILFHLRDYLVRCANNTSITLYLSYIASIIATKKVKSGEGFSDQEVMLKALKIFVKRFASFSTSCRQWLLITAPGCDD